MKRGTIYAARQGEDALTCHPRLRTIDSTKNQLKKFLLSEGTVTLPASTGGAVRVVLPIEHNLGYTPFIMPFAMGPADTAWQCVPGILSGNSCPAIYTGTTQGENETDIEFYTIAPDYGDSYNSQTIDYKYILFIDPSKDAWES